MRLSVKLSVTPWFLTLCNPMDCSPPGSSVLGILQTRILEWVAISYSRGSSQPRDWTYVSCIAGRFYHVSHQGLRKTQNIIKFCILHNLIICKFKDEWFPFVSDRMVSVPFQDKPFNITIIQVYASTTNADEAEVEWFYEDLQDLLELTPKKKKKKMSFS